MVQQRMVAVRELYVRQGNQSVVGHGVYKIAEICCDDAIVAGRGGDDPDPVPYNGARKADRAIAVDANPSRKVRTPQGRVAANSRPAAPGLCPVSG
ncbi:hypothetical protein GCM10027565_44430 [Bordetella tumulicola]